jgi:hypothetical protein
MYTQDDAYNLFSDEDIRKVLAGRNITVPCANTDLTAKEIGDRVLFLLEKDKDYYIVIDIEGRTLTLVEPKTKRRFKTDFSLVKLL